VISQDTGEGIDVLLEQKAVKDSLWQCVECGVRRGKDCEWTFSTQGVDQTGRFKRCDQSGEVFVPYCHVDDVVTDRWRCQHRIDGVDDSVRGVDVNKAVVNEDNRLVDTWWVKTDGDFISLKVEGRHHQSFGQVC